MKVLDRWECDGRRAAWSRAVPFVRAVVLAVIAGVAWLAGVAAAHADPIAGPAQDSEDVSGLVPVSTSIIDTVTAVPEQAALAPVNQLESGTRSILDVPGALLTTISGNDATKANHTVAASADSATSDTDNDNLLTSTANELLAPAGAGNSNVTSPRPLGSLLSVARPVTDSLAGMTNPVTAPLQSTAAPVNGRLGAATHSLVALTGFTHSAATAADQVGAMLMPTAPAPAQSGTLRLPVPAGVAGVSPARQQTIARDATVRGVDDDSTATAEQSQVVANGFETERLASSGDANQRDRSDGPVRVLGYPDPGITATGGASSGGSPLGCSPHDSGAGRCTFVHTDRNAQVSRVTPLTAVLGQLPDHVEDPAVSPD